MNNHLDPNELDGNWEQLIAENHNGDNEFTGCLYDTIFIITLMTIIISGFLFGDQIINLLTK